MNVDVNQETEFENDMRIHEHDDVQSFDQAGTNMIIGTNGIMVESTDSQVYFVYNPVSHMMDLKSQSQGSSSDSKKVSFQVQGKVYTDGIDILEKIYALENKIQQLQSENDVLRERVEEIYYAPHMPGFIQANINYYDNARLQPHV